MFTAGLATWHDDLAENQDSRFELSFGDIDATGDEDGRLRRLWLHPSVMEYALPELQQRLNMAVGALRDAAVEAFDPDALGET